CRHDQICDSDHSAHNLSESKDIANTTTINRDGQSIEALDMADPESNQNRIIRGMVGRELSSRYPERVPQIGDVVFEVENWSVQHPVQQDRTVVEGANLEVRAGEIVGIAGLMGAGRTELAMSIFGHSYGRNITGTVKMDGKPVDTSTVGKAIKAGIAYVSEDRKKFGLNLIEDIRVNTTAAGLDKISSKGFVDGNKEIQIAEHYRKSMRIKTPNVMA